MCACRSICSSVLSRSVHEEYPDLRLLSVALPAQGAGPQKEEGARSGLNTGHHQCKVPAGQDSNNPLVPWDYVSVGVGWLVVLALVSAAVVYLLVGTLAVPPFGKVGLLS